MTFGTNLTKIKIGCAREKTYKLQVTSYKRRHPACPTINLSKAEQRITDRFVKVRTICLDNYKHVRAFIRRVIHHRKKNNRIALSLPCHMQGCQMVYFQTKNPNLGTFLRAFEWKMFFTILWPFGMFCGHLVYFMAVWHSLWSFGIFSPILVFLDQEKSGNPCHMWHE
jgi:hypothetical protein